MESGLPAISWRTGVGKRRGPGSPPPWSLCLEAESHSCPSPNLPPRHAPMTVHRLGRGRADCTIQEQFCQNKRWTRMHTLPAPAHSADVRLVPTRLRPGTRPGAEAAPGQAMTSSCPHEACSLLDLERGPREKWLLLSVRRDSGRDVPVGSPPGALGPSTSRSPSAPRLHFPAFVPSAVARRCPPLHPSQILTPPKTFLRMVLPFFPLLP